MSDAIGVTGERSKSSQLKMAEPRNVATKVPNHPKIGCSVVEGTGLSVSNFPGNDNITEHGAEAMWENFAACCKLSSTEIFAI